MITQQDIQLKIKADIAKQLSFLSPGDRPHAWFEIGLDIPGWAFGLLDVSCDRDGFAIDGIAVLRVPGDQICLKLDANYVHTRRRFAVDSSGDRPCRTLADIPIRLAYSVADSKPMCCVIDSRAGESIVPLGDVIANRVIIADATVDDATVIFGQAFRRDLVGVLRRGEEVAT